MTTFAGTLGSWLITDQNQDGNGRLTQANWVADARTGSARWTAASLSNQDVSISDRDQDLSGVNATGNREPDYEVSFLGDIDNRAGAGFGWFEDVHVLPRSIDLGNLITSQTIDFDVFNGYRYAEKTFASFTNNAGSGISTSGLPSLPTSVFRLDTVEFDVIVDTDGDSTIDGTFDIVIGGETISVPISGSRIVMFPYQPNAPLDETLEFLTEVLTAVDGTEQRIALRKNPRQVFNFTVMADNDRERQRISNLLFDWQGRVFGLPVWAESTRLTSDVSVNDTTINVTSTANADYRTGDLAIVLKDDDTFDALTVASTTSTSITFSSEITNAYTAGDSDVLVMPLRTVFCESAVTRSKYKVGPEEFQLTFRVIDNDADLADTTGWTSHPSNSKVILDGSVKGVALNVVRGRHQGRLERRLVEIDSKTGLFTQSSPWNRSKDTEPLNVFVYDRALLWDVRQLLHALRGQQVSFYLPTFFPDVTVNSAVVSGGSTLQIVNAGYSQYSGDRVPRNLIRLTTTGGDEYIASVSSASEVDADTEALAVVVLLKNQVAAGPTWPDNIAVEDIERVDFVQKVRLASDSVTISHENGDGTANIKARIMTLFE